MQTIFFYSWHCITFSPVEGPSHWATTESILSSTQAFKRVILLHFSIYARFKITRTIAKQLNLFKSQPSWLSLDKMYKRQFCLSVIILTVFNATKHFFHMSAYMLTISYAVWSDIIGPLKLCFPPQTHATAFILKPDLHVKLYVCVRADLWVDGSVSFCAFSSKKFENLWKINQAFRLSLLLCRC